MTEASRNGGVGLAEQRFSDSKFYLFDAVLPHAFQMPENRLFNV